MEKTKNKQPNKQPKRPGKRRKKRARRWSRLIWAAFFTAAAGIFCAMAAYLFILVSGERYLNENAGKISFKETSIIYDRNGQEVVKLFVENREYVKIDEVPLLLQQAFIATEDKRFEEHEGIDYIGIGRALVKDIIARKAVEGASTITQQLARNLFLTNEKTFFRKATEMSIATALERRYTKDDILEMYLNRIFFGKAAYGVKAAAETYFGKKDLNDLTLAEMATLAAIPKAPSYYNPIDNPERSKLRRDTVLALMAAQGIITQEEKAAAQAEPVETLSYQTNIRYPSFVDYVMQEVQRVTDITEEELYSKGYQIYTTLDVKAQQSLEDAFEDPDNFPEDGPKQKVQSSVVILNNEDGGIAALIGGRDYARKGLNRAVVKRQPGSSFKPIAVYAPALESGNWHPYSRLSNEKQSFAGYNPRNLNGKYGGQVTMLEAVRRSINIPAVWLLNEIGVKNGLEFAKQLGIEMSSEDRNLSIALGGLTHGASPLEMARAYSAFAAGGKLHKPHSVVRIEDAGGKQRYAFDPADHAVQVMSEKTAWYTTLLLRDAVEQGTGKRAALRNHEVAGKTGTTQSGIQGVSGNRDIWFVGYTRDYTAAVWMGFDKTDKDHVLADYSGTAAGLFGKVMNGALSGTKSAFAKPQGVPDLKQSVDPVQDLTAVYSHDLHQIELNWTALPGQMQYRLFRKGDNDGSFLQIASTDKVSVIDLAIMPGTTYEYYVTVYDPKLNLESDPSRTAVVAVPEWGEQSPPLDEEPFEPDPIEPDPDLSEPHPPDNSAGDEHSGAPGQSDDPVLPANPPEDAEGQNDGLEQPEEPADPNFPGWMPPADLSF